MPIILLTPAVANTQELSFNADRQAGSLGAFGGVGLLEMRNARFSADGDLSIGVGHVDGGQNYFATWQATPWLEATLRFSDYNKADEGIDKGLDLKLRLVKEGKNRPAIAIGLQDMLGDGQFSGEYIVASKKINNFDVTMGFGFGQLANRARVHNISRVFGNRFKTRSFNDQGSEKLRFGNYFSGEKMGFFWGVEYRTPVQGLTAKIEYSTVDKSTIKIFEDYNSKTAFNFGLNYKVKNWLELSGGVLHGNQIALQLTLRQNLHKPVRLGFAKGPDVDEIRSRELKLKPTNVNNYKNGTDQDVIFDRLNQMGYSISAFKIDEDQIEISVLPNERTQQNAQVVLGAVLSKFRNARIVFPDGQQSGTLDDENGRAALDAFHSSVFFARELNHEELRASDRALLVDSISERMSERKLEVNEILIEKDEITVSKNVAPFIDIPTNIGRTVRILSSEAPDRVERFNVISKERGINVSKVSVLRKDFEKVADYNSSPEEILANAVIQKPVQKNIDGVSTANYPTFEYGLLPDIVSHFGSDNGDHFKGDLNLKIFGRTNISDDLQVYVEGKQHIVGNIDRIPVSTNPNVHHVRSDIGRYASEGTTSLRRLTIEYTKSPFEDIYTRLTAGHLEAMFTGVSGEILYRPYGNSFAFGFDLNWVKQRDFDQLFNMRDYETLTGHATAYYVNQKYDITSKVSVGRYLAKDWGTTIDVSRQFGNGIKIGAFATFTDMSESDFGRGNFDKGIYMTIPFDFFWVKQSRERASFKFRRLGKNGGQKLDHNTNLFNLLSASQPYKLRDSWGRILK